MTDHDIMRRMNNPRTRRLTRNLFFGFLGLLVVVSVIIAVTDSPDEITLNEGTVIRHDTEGNTRGIVVEVDNDNNLGEAATGLTDGESEFELVDGQTCP